MYDPGFPFPRSWLYGLGGFFFVAAALAIGLVIARPGQVEQRTPIVADRPADEVLVVRAPPERATVFPAFAPEGVIVVDAPSATQYASAAPETMTSERRVESARRRARLYERPPALARAEPSPPRTRETDAPPAEADSEPVEEPRQDIEPAQNEDPPAREYEEASNNEASEAESDNRSWYGSEEYQREVAERRRARRRGQ